MGAKKAVRWHAPQVDRGVRSNSPHQSPFFWASHDPRFWCCTPRKAAGGRAKSALGKFGFFSGFVFRTPIATNRVELFGGAVSGFEIRPVSASLRNSRQHLPPTPQRYASQSPGLQR